MIPMKGRMVAAVGLAFFCCSAAWCAKHAEKTLTAENGGPIRKIYVRSASADMTSSAANQLTQDTCLTVVPDAKQADAVLDVGIALPGLGGGGGGAAPDTFGPSVKPQTMGGNKSKPQRGITATCSDDKGSGGCSSSNSGYRGGLEQPAAEWPGNVGSNLDVSLTQPGDNAQELWEPDADKKRSWSDQLRQVAGCPVCPGEHFNRRKYQTYRSWIQNRCPGVLAGH